MAIKLKKGLSLILLVFVLLCSVLGGAYRLFIPDSIACMSLGELPKYPLVVKNTSSGKTALGQGYTVDYKLFGMLPVKSVRVMNYKDLKLYPGGIPFGIKFMTDGVLIVGFLDVCASGKTQNPAKDAGLRVNDIIKKINGTQVSSAGELTRIVEDSQGKSITVNYLREGKEYTATLTPALSDSEGKYKTGVYVRDSGAGIGTVTYINPNDFSFGGLGHGICDSNSGELVAIKRGSVVDVTISGVVRGEVGKPGEIKGYFSSGKTGTLLSNTECGVYGMLGECPQNLISEPLPVGLRSELHEGKAYIYCTLDTNKAEKYEIKISSIDTSAKGNKCFNIKITDKALLEKTGGIVQGMSGSPIIQNGKLVGAVTHVLINDPTTGYGIFIENMLNAAQMPMAKAS